MQLFLFRHGETDYNRALRFQGHTDIPLNTLGYSQAEDLALKLAGRGIQRVITSPLIRARTTGQTVAEALGVPLSLDERLMEINCGETEGMVRGDVITLYGEEFWRRWTSWEAADYDLRFKHGESKRECQQRARSVIDALLAEDSNAVIALSMHGAILRYLLHALLGDDFRINSIPNCGCYKVEFDPQTKRWSLEDLNTKESALPFAF